MRRNSGSGGFGSGHRVSELRCGQCREALSARIDGEPEPYPADRVDRHLADCRHCQTWQRRATGLTRALRVRPVPSVPDVTDAVLARAWRPGRTLARWRIALAAVAGLQIALGVAQVLGWRAGMTPGMVMHGDMATHLFDESTAWNLALGIGMAWVAWRTRAVAGTLPMFGVFLTALTAFCVRDVAVGDVTAIRIAEHGLLLIGFTLMLMLRRANGQQGSPAPRLRLPDDLLGNADEPDEPDTDHGGYQGLRAVNRHRAA